MPTVDATKQNTKSREARIRLRAEELYRRRGNRPGSALDDWLLAEKEIREDEEHAIDEALEESFPASDPPAH
jgi:Protein of unknown function (DUF2934)